MRGAVLAGALGGLLAFASPAAADLKPWDGSNPFNCTIQHSSSLQHPDADPFCVQYDNTQTVSDPQGIADFLTNQPARLAAGSSKCFYYELDHETSDVYSWDGAYFFNKRTGAGGFHMANFKLLGMTADPTLLPGFPPDLKPFFAPGGGGAEITGDVPIDPNCLPKAGGGGTSGGGSAGGGGTILGGLSGPNPGTKPRLGASCKNLRGNAKNGLGRARLGMKRSSVRHRFGKPTRRAHGFYHYCLRRGGDLAIHFGRHGRTDLVITNGKSFHAGKVKIGSRLRTVRGALRHDQVLGHRKSDWVIGVTHKRWRLLVGLAKNRVVYISVASTRLSIGALGRVLTNSGK